MEGILTIFYLFILLMACKCQMLFVQDLAISVLNMKYWLVLIVFVQRGA